MSCLSALSENVVEVGERQPEADVVVVLDTLNSLLAASFAELDRLDPALDVLLRHEVQHLNHLGPVADVRGSHVAAVGDEVLGHERGQTCVGQSTVAMQG